MRQTPTEIWGQQVQAYHIDSPQTDGTAPSQNAQTQTVFGCYKCAAKPALPTDPLPALNTVYFVNGSTLCIQHAGEAARSEIEENK